ncbi:brachyurin-like [Neocloeon triangulifer]|uniref:brachyurin-like n=1 Tax=Neocloeon triangulifer TaxID=2078957 RepID=UPI00286EB6D0|nr:brachyurin-like [Neocloeon triangulifer]
MLFLLVAFLCTTVFTQQTLGDEYTRVTRPIVKKLEFKSDAERKAYDEKTKPQIDGIPTGTKPAQPNAGRPTNRITAYIVGGTKASRGTIPWIAGIKTGDGSAFCGGSLITENAVLTAAHCAKNVAKFVVYLGMQNSQARSESGRTVMTSKTKYVNKGYNKKLLIHDIAIIKLPRKVSSNSFINTVKLPTASDASKTFVNTTATIAGWGLTSDKSTKISKELNYLDDRKVISNSDCAATYGEIESTMICISGSDKKAICSGDSGGPLTYKDANGANVQIGIVSFSHPSSCVGFPQVFTRVSSYLKFISDHTGLKIED